MTLIMEENKNEMKFFFKTLLFSVAFIFSSGKIMSQSATLLLKDNWRFSKEVKGDPFSVDYDASKWEKVTVPHDWAIYGPFDKKWDIQTVAIEQNGEKVPTEKTGRTGSLPHIGDGWYRKTFTVPEFNENKTALLVFEGAMSEPQVVTGDQAIPLFKQLATQSSAPRWNFYKYVVDRQGNVIASFSSLTKPDNPEFIEAVEKALASKS